MSGNNHAHNHNHSRDPRFKHGQQQQQQQRGVPPPPLIHFGATTPANSNPTSTSDVSATFSRNNHFPPSSTDSPPRQHPRPHLHPHSHANPGWRSASDLNTVEAGQASSSGYQRQVNYGQGEGKGQRDKDASRDRSRDEILSRETQSLGIESGIGDQAGMRDGGKQEEQDLDLDIDMEFSDIEDEIIQSIDPSNLSVKPSTSKDRIHEANPDPVGEPEKGRERNDRQAETEILPNNVGIRSVDPASLHTQNRTNLSKGAVSKASPTSNVEIQPSNYRTGLIYASEMMKHFNTNDQDHPESPERIFKIFATLKKNGFVERMKRIRIREAIRQEVGLVHVSSVWDGAEATAFYTRQQLDDHYETIDRYKSLYLNEHTAQCARLSCGGVIELCDAVASRKVQNGFAIVRPPGHHAEPDSSMGFCFYNNVAVAASWLLKKYRKNPNFHDNHVENRNKIERILIIDWDVHHGNGTQKSFYGDSNVLYVSIHRYDNGTFYPGGTLGSAQMVGDESAKGFNINIPWSKGGMGDGEYLKVFYDLIFPIATQYNPDFVLISAGFDAARGDTLGQCDVTPEGFGQMTSMLCSLSEGRCVAALEGGYNIDSIASSALEVTRVLLGDPPKPLRAELTVSALANDTIRQVKRIQSKYWKSLESSPHDPDEEDFEINPEEDRVSRDGNAGGIRSDNVSNGHREKSSSQIVDLSQLIKAYRKESLWKNYRLIELDFPDLEHVATGEEFTLDHDLLGNKSSTVGSAFCSEDVIDGDSSDVLVFFVHDFGNFKHERYFQSVKAEDELSYVLDSSGTMLDWIIKEKKYSVLDVNLNSQLQLTNDRAMKEQITLENGRNLNPISNSFLKTSDPAAFESKPSHTYSESEKEWIFMLWDSYIELSSSKNIVLIGHGNGCELLMSILNERNVTSRVKAVVMALGHGPLPLINKGRVELKSWYNRNSLVIVPQSHPFFTEDSQRAAGTRLGRVQRSNEIQPTRMLSKSLPDIIPFVESKLSG